jgi:hypothetical protein
MTASFTALEAGLAVLDVAREFLDESEVKPNAAWSTPVKSDRLRTLMQQAGWREGWPYCASFVEACYGHAYERLGASDAVVALIRRFFTPSVMQTFTNCGSYAEHRDPAPGAVFFMQKAMSPLGHAGLVLLSGRLRFATIEGNTSPVIARASKEREGDGIYLKIRELSFARTSGLWLRGFLNPLGSGEAEELAERIRAGEQSSATEAAS